MSVQNTFVLLAAVNEVLILLIICLSFFLLVILLFPRLDYSFFYSFWWFWSELWLLQSIFNVMTISVRNFLLLHMGTRDIACYHCLTGFWFFFYFRNDYSNLPASLRICAYRRCCGGDIQHGCSFCISFSFIESFSLGWLFLLQNFSFRTIYVGMKKVPALVVF